VAQHEPSDDAPVSPEIDDEFALVQGSAPWARRLTRRAKLLRIAVVAGVVALALSVIGGSSLVMRYTGDSPATRAPSNLRSAQPFPTLPVTSRRGSLPASAYTTSINAIDLAPGFSPDANVAPGWVCWVTDPRQPSPVGPSALHAARTRDGGLTWREIALPVTSASSCAMEVDHDTPARALVIVTTTLDGTTGACSTRLLLTRDNGSVWSEIPPAPAYATECAPSYRLVAGAIFASAGAEPATAQLRPVEFWRIDTTSSWISTSAGRPDLIVTAVAGQRSNGALRGAATFTDPTAGPGQIVESADRGATWSAIGGLPGANAALFLDEGPAESRSGAGALYAISDQATQPSGGSTKRALWRWNESRRIWQALPDIPHLSTAPNPLAQPDFAVIGVGLDGGLLVVAPGANQTGDDQSRQNFWYWNSASQRWLVSESQVALVVRPYGIGWSANNATLWLIYAHLGVPAHVELYTTTLT
jgi:hypothetical protein